MTQETKHRPSGLIPVVGGLRTCIGSVCSSTASEVPISHGGHINVPVSVAVFCQKKKKSLYQDAGSFAHRGGGAS